MKDMVASVVVSAGKWLLIGLIVAAVGAMLFFGLGKRRGTRMYRWRVAMWALAVGLITGGALVTSGCASSSSSKDAEPEGTCYMPEPWDADGRPGDVSDLDAAIQPDEAVWQECYVGPIDLPDTVDVTPPEAKPETKDGKGDTDATVMCYAEMNPDAQDAKACEVDVPIMCYEPVMDVMPQDVKSEAQPADVGPGEMGPGDVVQVDVAKDVPAEQDVFMECYNAGPPMDVKYPPK